VVAVNAEETVRQRCLVYRRGLRRGGAFVNQSFERGKRLD